MLAEIDLVDLESKFGLCLADLADFSRDLPGSCDQSAGILWQIKVAERSRTYTIKTIYTIECFQLRPLLNYFQIHFD